MKKPHLTPDQFSHEDLKKSLEKKNHELEELKRELQIEAALERVRVRTMAMQKSEELRELVFEYYKQIHPFGFAKWGFEIKIANEDKSGFYCWISPPGARVQPEGFNIPTLDHWVLKKYWSVYEQQIPITSIVNSGADKRKLAVLLLEKSDMKNLPEDVKANIMETEYVHFSVAAMRFGLLKAVDMAPVLEKDSSILQRFAKVFEQTYTRFLDLQKAEAQAREAQVEVALERVRAKTMGMHSSDELLEVVDLLYAELSHLDVELARVVLLTVNPETLGMHWWMASPEKEIKTHGFLVPPNDLPMTLSMIEAWKNKRSVWSYHLEGKDKKKYDKFLFSQSELSQLPEEVQMAMSSARHMYISGYGNNFGLLTTSTLAPLSSNNTNLLARFGQVFEQTYTRFLDLQKAEAQAREAQIELGLERVRARSMAMHKSEELSEVAVLLYQELTGLGLTQFFNCGYVEVDEIANMQYVWTSTFEGAQAERHSIPLTGDVVFDSRYKAWKRQDQIFRQKVGGSKLKKHFEFTNLSKKIQDTVIISFPDPAVFYCANFQKGYLHLIADSYIGDAEETLLVRFAKVFEQTYTRFLDLQKAEALSREAQIEVSLERIRAKAMAMRSSNELMGVAETIREQMRLLEQPELESSMVLLYDEEKFTEEDWFAIMPPKNSGKKILTGSITWRLDANEVVKKLFKIYKSGVSESAFNVKGKDLEELFKDIAEKFPALVEYYDGELPENIIHYVTRFSGGHILMTSYETPGEKSKELQRRVTNTFDLAYKRYLDLKNAEAQAREGQIEAALERIRSRTMAMRSSNELHEASRVLYQELAKLGFASIVSAFSLMSEDEKTVWYYFSNSEDGTTKSVPMGTPCTETQPMRQLTSSWKKQEPYHIVELDAKETIAHQTFIAERSINAPFTAAELISFSPKELKLHSFNFKQGYLLQGGGERLSPDQIDIMIRFTKAFQMTYTRFLDLQKAEAQAREAQIETALERVRSRTMAMHKSEELGETAYLLFQQMLELGVDPERFVIGILSEKEDVFNFWGTEQGGNQLNATFTGSTDEPTCISKWYKAIKEKKKSSIIDLSGEELKNWIKYLNEELLMPLDEKIVGDRRIHSSGIFSKGLLIVTSPQHLPDEQVVLLERFAAVFNQTYTRFLDLQKAEAQARESQIEAALERIRAKALAMQTSADLHGVSIALREQMGILGQPELESSIVHLYNHSTSLESWYTFKSTETNSTKIVTDRAIIPVDSCDYIKETIEKYNSKESEYTIVSKGKKLADWYKVMVKVAPDTIEYDDKGKILIPEILYYHHSKFSGGALLMISNQPPAEESRELQRRAARVFNFAYQRFLDLKKAEAQAREAQIETALERVRSKTMAMHTSQDVAETVSLLFNELVQLGLESNARCGIGIMNNSKYMELWTASTQEDGTASMNVGKLDMTLHPLLKGARNAFKQKKQGFSYVLVGKDLYDYYTLINQEREYSYQIDLTKLPERVYHNDFTFADGILYAFTNAPITDEISAIFRKFAVVFGQTYRRYLDLVNAEAQAREAQIEAALERVRSRSMAMQRSNELNEILLTMFGELSALGLALARCVIWIFNAEDRTVHWWAANPEVESGTESFLIPFTDHPTCNEYWKAWEERRVRYFYELSGETKRTWDDYLFNFTEMARLPEPVKAAMMAPEKVYLYNTFRDFGVLFPASLEPISEENFDIIERFGKVFDQSYTRFKDIQQAEAREKEAIKQSSLDRVRAEIASMRTTKDLQRITPLIWRELRTLDVPFFRCGVFIMNDEKKTAKVYLSTPSGESLAVWNSAYANVPLIQASAQHWREQKVFRDEWDQKQFIAFTKSLIEQKLINDPKHYQAGDTAPKHLVLQLVPFDQGMLYVGSDQRLDDDQIELVQALARSFSVAYARYEDFNELENAKTKVEATLNELKSTQAQLIQSEKMASLGELTAGIAHEIQNPLNFVNNFSEVSGELVDEMNEELEGGNMDEVKAITQDLKQNLEKINHHGQRASSIVKGMLEHSRTGTRQKELTDINILTDEYLRLSYHGLRAKDKFFNAEFKIDLDPSLPKINVIGQDIGRVLLNLINNAFYAVSEKAKKGIDGYAPVVTVKTKKVDHLIEIRVKDNANGIPPDIVNKIFQPFFTTKPTGSGTGLGLSLSYDIVTMGHNGSLEVDTTEGLGSEFIVQLPITAAS